ncbi:MAG: tRNA pseudouridine(13) synthase TruD [Candidatus Woesearchaeota archaeon]
MYKIKTIPEDFLVKELKNIVFSKTKNKENPFTIFLLKKKNLSTEEAVLLISKNLVIKRKYIGYAGIKDKRAITKQFISVFKYDSEKIKNLNIPNIHLKLVGYLNKPISIGDLKGNSFHIVVRNLIMSDIKKFKSNYKKLKSNKYFLPNYFDEQRFSRKNVEIGKLLLKKNFKKAAETILENEVSPQLKITGNNYIDIIKKVPKKILSLYIHSFQSYVFNETLKILLHNKKGRKISYSYGEFIFPDKKFLNFNVPIVGFGTELKGKIKNIILKILKDEEVELTDFIIRQLPEQTAYGFKRKAFFKVKKLSFSDIYDDDLYEKKKKIKINFILDKGSYATIVIKYLFS